MASFMIHIAVANEINKKLCKDEKSLLIGTIAPDISKLINESKIKSHFITEDDSNIPNIDKFLDKYRNNLNDDFVLGYYIHLYTDYLWFKYFIPEIYENDIINKLDGSIVKCSEDEMVKYIYNDYTNLNIKLIDEYDLNLKIFYEAIPKFKNIIEEIPMDKLDIIIDNASIIIENTKVHKDYVFSLKNVKQFIKTSTELILSNLKDLNIEE